MEHFQPLAHQRQEFLVVHLQMMRLHNRRVHVLREHFLALVRERLEVFSQRRESKL